MKYGSCYTTTQAETNSLNTLLSAGIKGTVKAEYNLPLKYCISIVLAKKKADTPFGLKKVTALVFLFNSEIVGTHF